MRGVRPLGRTNLSIYPPTCDTPKIVTRNTISWRTCTGGVNYSVLVATWPIPVSRANAPEHFSGLVMINYDHSKLVTSKFRRLTRTHGPQSWCGVKKTGILGRLTFLASASTFWWVGVDFSKEKCKISPPPSAAAYFLKGQPAIWQANFLNISLS